MFIQSLIPGFPEGAIRIGKYVSQLTQGNTVTYFVGSDNYIDHRVGDKNGLRHALCVLMANHHVRPIDIERSPLGIPHRTLMNWSARYAEGGSDALLKKAPARRKARVMTPETLTESAALLAAGHRPADIARQLGIDESTLRKAIARKAVIPTASATASDSHSPPSVPPETSPAEPATATPTLSTKSTRSRTDAQAAAGIGTACTRADERIAVAIGLADGAITRYEPSADVPMGGLLAGLPALCANGLLSGIGKHLHLPGGFYSCLHILITLGFMALGRIRRPENLRTLPPGEIGKLIGLDRVPEVRTLRQKIHQLASTGDPAAWMQALSQQWMAEDPAEAGYLYVDGHVRVYHGDQAQLPKRYVSRERLCLRGTTDYWVNDAIGRPFFVISTPLNEGMAAVILNDIVPKLLLSVPEQPSEAALAANPRLHRFVLVFDREGATHSLLSQLWEHRIGAITYRKNVKDTWPESEFSATEVIMPDGSRTTMQLATRETRLGQSTQSISVKEVRRLTASGHQTAVVSTALELELVTIAARMFARWCQENYFAYMMQHYDIDGLIQYGVDAIPGTESIINPKWRLLDKEVSRQRTRVRKLAAALATTGNETQTGKEAETGREAEAVAGAAIHQRAERLEALQAAQAQLEALRTARKAEKRKVTIDSLPEAERPTQLMPLSKQLTDAVKMIAYRAETALMGMLRRHLKNLDEGRALVRALLVSAADIVPDEAANTLTVRIHRMACPAHDKAVMALLDELTAAEFYHPETKARMIYELV